MNTSSPVAADVSPLQRSGLQSEPTHVGCYNEKEKQP